MGILNRDANVYLWKGTDLSYFCHRFKWNRKQIYVVQSMTYICSNELSQQIFLLDFNLLCQNSTMEQKMDQIQVYGV